MEASPSYRSERDTAVAAARDAARLIRGRAGQFDPTSVRDKNLNELVTEVDEAAQHTIVERLRTAFPSHAILAEEGDRPEAPDPAAEGKRWIIDPLDGTTNFTYGIPPFAVSIALQDGARLAVGVVLEVASDTLYTAVRGHGLYVDGTPAGVSGVDGLAHSLLATGFPYRRFEHTETYLGVLGHFMKQTRGVRRHGAAAVDLARVAAGRFTGFFETGLSPWDVAAGTLLVEEGGGRVTDFRDQPAPHPVFDGQILASNGAIHAAMLEGLTPLIDTRA